MGLNAIEIKKIDNGYTVFIARNQFSNEWEMYSELHNLALRNQKDELLEKILNRERPQPSYETKFFPSLTDAFQYIIKKEGNEQ